jgi:hypothetical protein
VRTYSSWLALASVALLVAASCLLGSCSDSSPSDPDVPNVILITDEEHHLGDNPGSEGQTYDGNFTISGSFGDVEVSIKFLYPNSAGQSGPEIDSPPDIMVNGAKVGLYATDFPDNAGCISQYREYECDVTIVRDATAEAVQGVNTIQVVAQGVAHPGDDDFVFTDLRVVVYPD